MCGIAAVFSPTQIASEDACIAEAMIGRQRHRGPDHAATVRRDRFAIGHCRLRILDVGTRADQPLVSDDEAVYVSFNGEIFNDRDLRERLTRDGAVFRTSTDTETVLRLYEDRGLGFVDELEGQFAICIVDERNHRMVLCRDRFGICPLYYLEDRGRVYVSSSLRALIRSVPGAARPPDGDCVSEYLLLRFVLPPRTIVPRVRQLRPGEILVFGDGAPVSRRYWSLDADPDGPPDADRDGELREVVIDSVRRNTRSDAAIAVFLSGGLDSSIVASEAARATSERLTAVSIRFGDDDVEESESARLVARRFGCTHDVFSPDAAGMPDLVEGCLAAIDHPTGARDMLAMFGLARRLREARPDVKVVLTGTGADELFNGYRNAYFQPDGTAAGIEELCQRYVRLYSCSNEAGRHALGRVAGRALPLEDVASRIAGEVRVRFPRLADSDGPNVLNAFYIVTHLVGWELAVQDTMCMQHSIEPRVPFLGRAVVERAMSMRGSDKCRGTVEKAVLRHAFVDRLPSSVCSMPKLPLSRPVSSWLWDHGFLRLVRGLSWRDRGLFDRDGLESLTRPEDFDVLWRLFVLETWLQQNVD